MNGKHGWTERKDGYDNDDLAGHPHDKAYDPSVSVTRWKNIIKSANFDDEFTSGDLLEPLT